MRLYSPGQMTRYLLDRTEIRESDRINTTIRVQVYYPAFNFDSFEFRFTLDNCFRISWRRRGCIRYLGIGGSVLGLGAAIEYAQQAMPLDPLTKESK